MMQLLNCTPHPLHVECADGRLLILAPEPTPARCAQTEQSAGTLASGGYDVALTRQAFGAVEGLPEPRPHVRLVVSRLVAEACPERDDLLLPGPAIRDETGRIVGCRGLSVLR